MTYSRYAWNSGESLVALRRIHFA